MQQGTQQQLGRKTRQMPISGSPSLTGRRIIVVRSVSPGGIESKESLTLEIEYKNGYIVRPAPNAPSVRQEALVDGLTFTVYAHYDASNQKAYPIQFGVYLTDIDTPFDWDTAVPVAYFTVGTIAGTLLDQDLVVDPGAISDGQYLYAIRAFGLDGIPEQNINTYRIHLSEEEPDDVEDFESVVSRS